MSKRRVLPTERSLRLLRRQGYTCGVVERWIPTLKRRADLFGFADVIAMFPEQPVVVVGGRPYPQARGIVAVQCTTMDHQADRAAKVLAEPRALVWLQAGGRIIVHGWSLKGSRGTRKLWECTERELMLDDPWRPQPSRRGRLRKGVIGE